MIDDVVLRMYRAGVDVDMIVAELDGVMTRAQVLKVLVGAGIEVQLGGVGVGWSGGGGGGGGVSGVEGMRLVSEVNKEQAIKMYQEGAVVSNICRLFHISVKTLYEWMAEEGVPIRGWTPRELSGEMLLEDEIIQMYAPGGDPNAGAPLIQIMTELGITRDRIGRTLRKRGIPVRKMRVGVKRPGVDVYAGMGSGSFVDTDSAWDL